ncbi:hypothetical protein, partial [Halochromatium sp.]
TTAGIFLDIQDLPMSAEDLTFPLSPEAWLLTSASPELHGRSTRDALRDGDARCVFRPIVTADSDRT